MYESRNDVYEMEETGILGVVVPVIVTAVAFFAGVVSSDKVKAGFSTAAEKRALRKNERLARKKKDIVDGEAYEEDIDE